MSMGRKRLKERETDPKIPLVNFTHFNQMNTLTTTIIKKQIDKAAALHDAQINITKYRGVDCAVHQGGEEVHGTYCYRGRTYVK